MNLVVQVKVPPIGSRSGCPSSTATQKGRVETLLKTHITEISDISGFEWVITF